MLFCGGEGRGLAIKSYFFIIIDNFSFNVFAKGRRA
jgi:hypothetical protein